ncbi:hypothetical protein L798_03072 [Zootermopsis nevadensis]|uniref:Uncharacterized protein n=1 Tax=Zootermopsis nevadensis TaxID=136037 RepID=A0A067RG85_ZOONE|nr:hypothetical protein L798_03072 [Zootermopsis nevadensis]
MEVATGVVLVVSEAVAKEAVATEVVLVDTGAKADTEVVDLEVAVDLEEAVDMEVVVDLEEVTVVKEDMVNTGDYKYL